MTCNLRGMKGYMGIRSVLLSIIPVSFCVAQDVVVRGFADPSFARQPITLSVAKDYVTGIPETQDTDTVNADGSFSLAMKTEFTRPATLAIGKVSGSLFVRPDYVYSVRFPAPAAVDPHAAGQEVDVAVVGSDSTELNALVIDYQDVYNNLMSAAGSRYLSRPALIRRADSLWKICDVRYARINDDYFRNYFTYSIASLNAAISRGRSFLMAAFITGKPVLVDHSAYMEFFQTCFRGYFNAVASKYPGRSLYNIVNEQAELKQLDDFVRQDPVLANDTLRELVIISSLWESCFDPQFRQEQVLKIISQLNRQTSVAAHRRITSNMMGWFGKLLPGSAAPDFTVLRPDGSKATLSSLKGRWIYLNFFSTSNIETLREMPKIAALKKAYGDKITFVSICVDDSVAAYRRYLRTTPGLSWAVWFDGVPGMKAREKYYVTGGEGYFLVSNAGYLQQSPALSPSKGIEYQFNKLFKTKAKTRKTGIR
jgi:hypothetical protein